MAKLTLRTKLCDELGIDYPIMSAGMGSAMPGIPSGAPVELVVAVSEAGGLGVLGAAGYTLDEMQEKIREIRKLTDKPFGVDILLPREFLERGDLYMEGAGPMKLFELLKSLPKEHYEWLMKLKEELGFPDVDVDVPMNTTTMCPKRAMQICLEERVPLFCSGLGSPDPIVEEAHKRGMKVLGVVGNTKNAVRVAQSGADYVVAQGHEGGGHTGRVGSVALWPQALDAIAPTPLIAAGGIGDGRGIAAALAMGCSGVWIGTRFLATSEGGCMQVQKDAVIEASDEDTRRSRIYTGKPCRVTYNRYHDLWDESGLPTLPMAQQVLLASAIQTMAREAEQNAYIGQYAGQIAGMIHDVKPAGQLLEELVAETVEILAKRLPQLIEPA